MTTVLKKLSREDRGASALEFALAAPVLLLLVFGLIYVLLVVAAQASLSHSASLGVRHASIPVDMVHDRYPAPDEVADKVFGSTPFFDSESCPSLDEQPIVTGDEVQNAPIVLEVECEFPSPLGAYLNGLLGTDRFGDSVRLSARAVARRE